MKRVPFNIPKHITSTKHGVLQAGNMLWLGLCFCIWAATAAMASLQVQTIIDDMTRPHEGRPQDVWNTFDWGGRATYGERKQHPLRLARAVLYSLGSCFP